jgi:type III pantothenate kinase
LHWDRLRIVLRIESRTMSTARQETQRGLLRITRGYRAGDQPESILLVDIGNTRIKWACFDGERIGPQHAAVIAGWRAEDYARRVIGRARDVNRIIVASVAGPHVDREFAAAARREGVAAEFVRSQRRAAGVTTQYVDPWRLGVDRFVGAIGAHHLAKHRPVCVIAVGTALTIDLVDGRGRHRGGAILPAPDLMVDSLLKSTNGIRRRARGGVTGGRTLFARATRAAIEQGARHAAAAVIDRAIEISKGLVGKTPLVVITGGAAHTVRPLVCTASVCVPDLVLQGLAVLSRQGAGGMRGARAAREARGTRPGAHS